VEPNGYLLVPVSIEYDGRVGGPAMKLLHDLGDDAASPGTHFTRASLVAGALRELSIGLSCGISAMYQTSAECLACVTCQSAHTGMGSPSDEVV
jgi:hypothetical protein